MCLYIPLFLVFNISFIFFQHIQVPLENKKKSVSLVQNQHMEVFQSVFDDNLAQITAKHVSQLKTIELQFIYELVALKFDLTKEQDSQKVEE